MSLNVTEAQNDTKIYHLTAGRTDPEFIKTYRQNLLKMKKEIDYVRRIEFIQNFQFPVASSKIEVSADGEFILASGIYAPQMKIFSTSQLSQKCMRGFDSEIVDFKLLSEDYSKFAAVCQDRNVEVHAQYGKHFKVR